MKKKNYDAALVPILFWNYYFFEKDEYTKLEKLANIRPGIILGHIAYLILLGIFGIGFFKQIVGLSEQSALLLFIVAIVPSLLGSMFFQADVCKKADRKINYSVSIRGLLKDGVGLFSSIIKDDIDDLINEFFSKDHKYYYQENYDTKDYYKTMGDESQKKYSDGMKDDSNEVLRIFDKYNLAYDSDPKTIKKHFRTLCKKYHPDMPEGDAKKFMELRSDMEYLSKHL